jgi:hypothetical protein
VSRAVREGLDTRTSRTESSRNCGCGKAHTGHRRQEACRDNQAWPSPARGHPQLCTVHLKHPPFGSTSVVSTPRESVAYSACATPNVEILISLELAGFAPCTICIQGCKSASFVESRAGISGNRTTTTVPSQPSVPVNDIRISLSQRIYF